MKIALLIGNRFNAWHFQGYRHVRGNPQFTVFRAESEIQKYFDERNDIELPFDFEPMQFESAAMSLWRRLARRFDPGSPLYEPRVVPFHERLRGFDVIQSWELFSDWSEQALKAREKFGVPVAIMVWDNIPFNNETKPYRRAIKQQVLAHADRFIVHTERSRRMLDIEGAPEDKIVLVPPAVDTDLFSPGSPIGRASVLASQRAGFGLADDDFVILFVGWFLPRKGIDFLLFALRDLLKNPALNKRRLRLLVVGSGPGKPRVDDLVTRLNIQSAVTFAGSVPYSRMPDVFRSADVLAMPSIAMPDWQEQFGMAIIEAMACGIPVVTTHSGAIPEIVGESAILCQPNDFVSLASALETLIQDAAHREALSAAGRARAVNQFNLERFGAAISNVYEGLAG